MHRKATFLILSFLLALFSNDFASAQTLKIPYVSISGFQAPLYLGERAGLFKKNQLEAQLIYMPGGSLIVQTFAFRRRWRRQPRATFGRRGVGERRRAGSGRRRHRARAQCADGQSKDQKARRFEGQASGDQPLRLAVRCLAARRLAFYKLRANQDVQVAQMGGLGERMVALTSGAVDGAILNVDQVFQAEKLGFQVLIDLRKLPLNYSTQGIVVSKDFLRAQRSAVKRFLRVYIEGIKLFKTDKEFSMETLGRYIKTSDREILSKTYDVYREAWETVPLVRREGIQQALDSISGSQRNAEAEPR